MKHLVSKSSFKARTLQYLRQVESTGEELVITDHGKPVLKIVPYTRDPEEALRALRGSVIRYVDPLEPVGMEGWESTDLETVALSTDPEFLEPIQNSRSRHTCHGGLSSSEMRRRLEELQD